ARRRGRRARAVQKGWCGAGRDGRWAVRPRTARVVLAPAFAEEAGTRLTSEAGAPAVGGERQTGGSMATLGSAEVYATLLDEGHYHCSERTMYRLLAAQHEGREPRNQLRHPHYAA